MKQNTILLITGVILTLLFIVFSTPLFEFLYYEREFSNEMYAANLYFTVALVEALVAWGVALVFYYIINSVSFSRWYHWLIMLVISIVFASTISYLYADAVFANDGVDFSNQLFGFSAVSVSIEFLLFIIASFAMRWWSSNCRHTPIPE